MLVEFSYFSAQMALMDVGRETQFTTEVLSSDVFMPFFDNLVFPGPDNTILNLCMQKTHPYRPRTSTGTTTITSL